LTFALHTEQNQQNFKLLDLVAVSAYLFTSWFYATYWLSSILCHPVCCLLGL